VDIVAERVLRHAEVADEAHVDSRLFLHLADRGLLDALSVLDAAAGHDGGELGIARDVEDEQLVGTRLRMLARDVRRDRRPRPQVRSALILAL
jgi:hypothetical protein